jgi:nitrite reductase/ring-hydroxylating ferredoxin subunit
MNELFAICRTNQIDGDQPSGFWLAVRTETGETKPWPIVIGRKGNRFFGYENVCPHTGSRLDTEHGQFLDDGNCFIGPCKGQHLTPVTLVIDDGDVCVTGVELAEEDGLDRGDA